MASYWHIIEEDPYRISLDMICDDILSLAPSIAIIDHGLRRNPHGFVRINAYEDVYIAKTNVIISIDYIIPALRTWYTVHDEVLEVRKCWIDLVPVDEIDNDPDSP
jgi:hypothetical protein